MGGMNPIRSALAECLASGELVLFQPWADGNGLLVGRVVELTDTRGTPYLAELIRLAEDDGPDDLPLDARRPAEIRTLFAEAAGRLLALSLVRKGESSSQTVLVERFEDDVAVLRLFHDGEPVGRQWIPATRIRSLRIGRSASRRGRFYQACSSENARP